MSTVSWLHISDLHILSNDPEWENYRECLLKAFHKKPSKPKFVVITGDYRNIWKNESFNKAEQFIRELMFSLDLDLVKDLFIVPGNHDLQPRLMEKSSMSKHIPFLPKQLDADRRTLELKKLLPAGLSPWKPKANEKQWLSKHEKDPENYIDRLCGVERDSVEDNNIVDIPYLLHGFNAYREMAASLIPWYLEGGTDPAAAHCRKWEDDGGTQFNIVHLNTALVADGSRCHYQALDLRNAQRVLGSIQNGFPTLIIAHNSFYDLHPEIQKELLPGIKSANVCMWLCGDWHIFSSESKIWCPGKTNPIPIYICGKGSPDNRDSFSENGFFYYEWDGTSFTAQSFDWHLQNTVTPNSISKTFPDHVGIPTATAAPCRQLSTPQPKRLFIGYLSCNPKVALYEKYHLGHALFIHMLDQKLRNHDHVVILTSSYVLNPNQNIEAIQKKIQYTRNMIHMWKACFSNQVNVVDIKDYLGGPILIEPVDQALLIYVSKMEFKITDNLKFYSIIEKWHQIGDLENTNDEYNYILDLFEVEHQSSIYKKEEVLSFAYLLYKRPVWYNSIWLINFIHFWNMQMYPFVQKNLGISVESNEIFIVEAKRNAYVWNAISYCVKRFSYMNFPKVEYFQSLLDTDCAHPMKSSNKESTFFLKDYGAGKDCSKAFGDHLHQMFETEKSPSEVADEYFHRLNLEEYR